MKAVIIGATGATGKELLNLLLESGDITAIKVLTRRPLDIHHPKLKVAIADFEKENWHAAVSGDLAFSCMGTTLKAAGSKNAQYKVDFGYQLAFAKAARKNDIKKLMLISAGMANASSRIFYPRMKGELEEAIRALHFETFVIFRPGLLQRPATDRLMEKWSVAILAAFNKIGLFSKLAPLPVTRLAKLMLHEAHHAPKGEAVWEPAQILERAKTL